MSNSTFVPLLCLMSLFMTTVILFVPNQTQGQPNSPANSCFPVETNAETLMCTEGPAAAGPDSNFTS